MVDDFGRREYDALLQETLRRVSVMETSLAVCNEQVRQLTERCDKKDTKIEVLQAFQNKAIGYATAAAAAVSLLFQYFPANKG